MRRTLVGLGVLGLSACFFGCGGGEYSSPKATFQTMFEAIKAGNREKTVACVEERAQPSYAEVLKFADELYKEEPDFQEEMGGKGLFAMGAEQARKAKIVFGAEKITGDTATLEVTIDGDTLVMNFVRERGAWRIKAPEQMRDAAQVRQAIEKIQELKQKIQGRK